MPVEIEWIPEWVYKKPWLVDSLSLLIYLQSLYKLTHARRKFIFLCTYILYRIYGSPKSQRQSLEDWSAGSRLTRISTYNFSKKNKESTLEVLTLGGLIFEAPCILYTYVLHTYYH